MKITTAQHKSLMASKVHVIAPKTLCRAAGLNPDNIRHRLKYGSSLKPEEEQALGEALESALPHPWHSIQPILDLIDEQAEDKGLWFQPEYITEDCLQKALRKLHALVEGLGRKGAEG